jgi:hypothetical protein
VDPGPDVQIVGESTRVRLEDPVPAKTPWLVDGTVPLIAARGEKIGIQVLHRSAGPVTLAISAMSVLVRGYAVESYKVTRPSTEMYGGGREGTFADALSRTNLPLTSPAYFEIDVSSRATPGTFKGELVVGDPLLKTDKHFPVTLTILPLVLDKPRMPVWAYDDPREFAWAAGPAPTAPSDAEKDCAEVFAEYGVTLMPDLKLEWWPARKPPETSNLKDLPVVIPTDPAQAGEAVKAWIAATKDSGYLPFAIPIDEPGASKSRDKVVELAKAVRAAGGGPTTFRFAVTDEPQPEYGDLVDLYISLRVPRTHGGTQWTYNGAPPRAGSMVLDAQTPGMRTWGWIGHRWNIPVWYVWDALYWHDRHNRKDQPPKALDPRVDPTSFDSGEDHGNLDGVLSVRHATTGECQPTLRLVSLYRGLQDRQLLAQAAACDPAKAEAIAARMVPSALGDAPKEGAPSWPTDESAWELARRELHQLASCNVTPPPK